jgi:2-dehydropantoate 2-reductase
MKILIFGAGAIGSIYGYFLCKSGNEVVHFVREERVNQLTDGIKVDILDGRDEKRVLRIEDEYKIKFTSELNSNKDYDLILVSIKHGSLESVLKLLKESSLTASIVFLNGLWQDYSSIDPYLERGRYLWGYPVAGGNIDYETRKLEGAILNNILIGEIDGKMTERLKKIMKMFADAHIKVETPPNILHWIWIHMAINAAVISTCLKWGSAAAFMNSSKALKEGILTMRELLKVVKARGVSMEDFKKEIKPYYFPTFISSILFKRFFKKNIIPRKIMELHNNMQDLYEICNDVYKTAQELGIKIPLFSEKSNFFLGK